MNTPDSHVWQAPQLIVLGTLNSVTEAGVLQVGDANPNGDFAGSSGSIS